MLKKLYACLVATLTNAPLINLLRLLTRSTALRMINSQPLSREELANTDCGVSRARLAEGETLEDLLPEAFAAVREASKRTLGLRHYDVQLIGGIALHQGQDRRDAHRRR